ncbi:MAG: hydrogenase iron-sulfur subunit [Chloroflexi bacterium]|nr:hydrogenase iron-sulfur subunit [Chloroflexota bacterium]
MVSEKTHWSGQWAAFSRSVDWPMREGGRVKKFLRFLERLTLTAERPINRFVRDPRFNPLYHTGTIAVFLLLLILVTGVYLMMFYQFGLTQSHQAVANIERSLVGRTIRALHRYASDLAIILIALHAWRTFFMDRFRGPRWLAWVSGVIMTIFVWIAGVTGYWMVADVRSQTLTLALINAISATRIGAAFLVNNVVRAAAGSGWTLFFILFVIHLGLSLLIGLFFWLHIKRLSRAKLMPPRYWALASFVLLALVSALIPVGMRPPTDPSRLPGEIAIDLWYLFFLPGALSMPPGVFWGGIGFMLLAITALPWLLKRKPLTPIAVDAKRCIGCALCAEDCPYNALRMVDRDDHSEHPQLAVVDAGLCVACGVCIGSCPTEALTLDGLPAEALWEDVRLRAASSNRHAIRMVFVCERHAVHGASSYLHAPNKGASVDETGQQIAVIPLTCIAMAHPNLAAHALEWGATAVQFVGCPPEDCVNREGNVWMEQRLTRRRQPKLRRALVNASIGRDWLPPDDFSQALRRVSRQHIATAYDFDLGDISWKRFLPALLVLGVSLILVALLSETPYRPFPPKQALVEVALNHRSGYPIRTEKQPSFVLSDFTPPPPSATRLMLEVDGRVLLDKTYPPLEEEAPVVAAFEQIPVEAGEHDVRLTMQEGDGPAQILYDARTTLAPGQVLPLHLQDARAEGGDPERGRALYFETSLGTNASCRICHSLEPGVVLVGPSFAGIASRAATRAPGMSAEEYIRQSILEPDAYVVEGFQPGMEPPNFAELLTEEQIDDLVAFLMTLK